MTLFLRLAQASRQYEEEWMHSIRRFCAPTKGSFDFLFLSFLRLNHGGYSDYSRGFSSSCRVAMGT